MRVSSSGGCTSVISPHSNRVLQPVLEGGQLFGWAVGRDDDLLVGVVQRVEGVEELFLDAFLALDELDVIDEQHVDVAVAAFEGDLAVVAERVDEVVGEFLGGDVLDPHPGEQPLRIVAGGMQQVCLAETRLAPNEQRVVGAGGCFGDRQSGGVREPIGGTDDEGVEGVAAVEAGSVGGGSRFAAVWALGEVGGPAFLDIAERLTVFIRLVGLRVQVVVGGGEKVRLSEGGVLGKGGVVAGGGRCDADPKLYLLSEPSAQGIGDRCPQMTFDLILDEAARHRQQRKSLDDGERLDEVQPGSLLRG